MDTTIKASKSPIWQKWVSIGLSVLAIVLSQFEPIHVRLRSPEIQPQVADVMILRQYFGRLNFSNFINLRNTGEKQGTIQTVACYIASKEDNNFRVALKATTLSMLTKASSSFSPEVPFTPIILRPGEDVNSSVEFSELHIRESDKVDSLATAVATTIDPFLEGRITQFTNGRNEPILSKLDKNLVTEIEKISYANLNRITPGGYYILVAFYADDETPISSQLFSFDISEYAINKLKRSIGQYKMGRDISMAPVYILHDYRVTLNRQSDKQLQNNMEEQLNARLKQTSQ